MTKLEDVADANRAVWFTHLNGDLSIATSGVLPPVETPSEDYAAISRRHPLQNMR